MKIHLIRAADIDAGPVELGLNFRPPIAMRTVSVPSFDYRMKLPIAGQAIVREIDLTSLVGPLQQGLGVSTQHEASFDAALMHGGARLDFGYREIGMDDTLTLVQIEPTQFLANVLHRSPMARCRVRCADGREGQPCVVCESGGLTVRVCC